MRILIAPDKFKGSLSAPEVAENIARGLAHVLPQAKIDILPLADGGEGTAEVICAAIGGSSVHCPAHDPLGREIDAHYAWIDPPSPSLRRDTRKLAVMEMSEAAGMRRVSENERDPLRANTFGVGEMILDAARRGARDGIRCCSSPPAGMTTCRACPSPLHRTPTRARTTSPVTCRPTPQSSSCRCGST